MCFTEWITLIKDLILSGAAITASFVAVKGLGTWKAKLRGESEYELSKRILVTLEKYRDAINGVRSPAIWVHETPLPPENKAKDMTSEDIRFYGVSTVYQTRWEQVQIERSSMYADILEAEVIWEDEFKGLFNGVFELQHNLFISVQQHLECMNPDTSQGTKDSIREIQKKSENILYSTSSIDDPDQFTQDLTSAIKKIEIFLKPKLKYK